MEVELRFAGLQAEVFGEARGQVPRENILQHRRDGIKGPFLSFTEGLSSFSVGPLLFY